MADDGPNALPVGDVLKGISEDSSVESGMSTDDQNGIWQFEDGASGSGNWRDMSPGDSSDISDARRTGKPVVLQNAYGTYEVTLDSPISGKQRNVKTNATRSVRWKSYSSMPKSTTTTSAPVVVTGTTTVTSSSSAQTNTDDDDMCQKECTNFQGACAELVSTEDIECGIVGDGDWDALKESCTCIDKDNENDQCCTSMGSARYLLLLPFLPFALAWLFLKWVCVNTGPCILLFYLMKWFFTFCANVLCVVCTKLYILVSIVVYYFLIFPFKSGCHYFVVPACVWFGTYVLTPICNCFAAIMDVVCDVVTNICNYTNDWVIMPICNCVSAIVTFLVEQIFIPTCNAISTCCAFLYNSILLPFVTAINNCVSALCSALYNAVSAICSALYNAVSAVCTALYTYVWSPLWRGITACANCIHSTLIEPCCSVLTCVCENFANGVIFVLDLIGSCFSAIYTNVLEPIGSAIYAVLAAIGNVIYMILAAIFGALYAILSAIASVISAAWNAFVSILP